MSQLEKEIEENFATFSKNYWQSAQDTVASLASRKAKYLDSYKRIVTLQAWRSELLERRLSVESFAFFLEAQNDALTSHVLARFGSWRSSLKSLRSCIENALSCLYYMDHPVELELWDDGRNRLTFSNLEGYFRAHPRLKGIPKQATGMDELSEEYSTLSRAVHGSAKTFRMSGEGIGLQLWSNEPARLGMWGTREKATMLGLNRLLMTLFRDQLQGNRVPNLRKALSLIVPEKNHAGVKNDLGINILPLD